MKVTNGSTESFQYVRTTLDKATHITSSNWTGMPIHAIRSINMTRLTREATPVITDFEVFLHDTGVETTKYANLTPDFAESLVFFKKEVVVKKSVVVELTELEACNLANILGNFSVSKCPISQSPFSKSMFVELKELGINPVGSNIDHFINRGGDVVDYIEPVYKSNTGGEE